MHLHRQISPIRRPTATPVDAMDASAWDEAIDSVRLSHDPDHALMPQSAAENSAPRAAAAIARETATESMSTSSTTNTSAPTWATLSRELGTDFMGQPHDANIVFDVRSPSHRSSEHVATMDSSASQGDTSTVAYDQETSKEPIRWPSFESDDDNGAPGHHQLSDDDASLISWAMKNIGSSPAASVEGVPRQPTPGVMMTTGQSSSVSSVGVHLFCSAHIGQWLYGLWRSKTLQLTHPDLEPNPPIYVRPTVAFELTAQSAGSPPVRGNPSHMSTNECLTNLSRPGDDRPLRNGSLVYTNDMSGASFTSATRSTLICPDSSCIYTVPRSIMCPYSQLVTAVLRKVNALYMPSQRTTNFSSLEAQQSRHIVMLTGNNGSNVSLTVPQADSLMTFGTEPRELKVAEVHDQCVIIAHNGDRFAQPIGGRFNHQFMKATITYVFDELKNEPKPVVTELHEVKPDSAVMFSMGSDALKLLPRDRVLPTTGVIFEDGLGHETDWLLSADARGESECLPVPVYVSTNSLHAAREAEDKRDLQEETEENVMRTYMATFDAKGFHLPVLNVEECSPCAFEALTHRFKPSLDKLGLLGDGELKDICAQLVRQCLDAGIDPPREFTSPHLHTNIRLMALSGFFRAVRDAARLLQQRPEVYDHDERVAKFAALSLYTTQWDTWMTRVNISATTARFSPLKKVMAENEFNMIVDISSAKAGADIVDNFRKRHKYDERMATEVTGTKMMIYHDLPRDGSVSLRASVFPTADDRNNLFIKGSSTQTAMDGRLRRMHGRSATVTSDQIAGISLKASFMVTTAHANDKADWVLVVHTADRGAWATLNANTSPEHTHPVRIQFDDDITDCLDDIDRARWDQVLVQVVNKHPSPLAPDLIHRTDFLYSGIADDYHRIVSGSVEGITNIDDRLRLAKHPARAARLAITIACSDTVSDNVLHVVNVSCEQEIIATVASVIDVMSSSEPNTTEPADNRRVSVITRDAAGTMQVFNSIDMHSGHHGVVTVDTERDEAINRANNHYMPTISSLFSSPHEVADETRRQWVKLLSTSSRVFINSIDAFKIAARQNPTGGILDSRVLILAGLSHLPESATISRLCLEGRCKRIISIDCPQSVTPSLFTNASVELAKHIRGPLAQLHYNQRRHE